MTKTMAEDHNQYKKGSWTEEEDKILTDYIKVHGKGKWNHIAKNTGLKRCGKSCRLRWINYLSPNVKRGSFTEEEEDLIIRLHNLLGNRWSLIAKRVPGRTDNQVKNYWNTHMTKKLANIGQNGRVRIRKGNGSVGVSSSTNKSMPDKVSKIATNSGLSPFGNTSATTEIELDTGSEKAKEVSNTQELLINDDVKSFWISDDAVDPSDFSMKFFDGYSFDLD